MYNAVVNFKDGDQSKTLVDGDKNLLEELEGKGVMIARGCLAGSCGVCRMEVLTGIDNFSAPDAVEQDTITDLESDGKKWRLACCAQVTGDVEVVVDKDF